MVLNQNLKKGRITPSLMMSLLFSLSPVALGNFLFLKYSNEQIEIARFPFSDIALKHLDNNNNKNITTICLDETSQRKWDFEWKDAEDPMACLSTYFFLKMGF